MNDSRHQELLGRVLDDELTSAETDELIDWLRQDPAGRSEVRKHLQLWELFGQQVRAERSAGAFVEACRTRLVAESDERKFVRETEQRLLRSVQRGGNKAADRLLLLRQWIARLLPSPRWALAAGVAMLCVFVLPGLLCTQGLPELATVTAGEVQILRGNQSVPPEVGLRLQPTDVVRTTLEGEAVITYGREATRIELKPGTELKLLTWGHGKRFDLRAGKLAASVARQRLFRPMTITTTAAEARVMGTKFTLTTTTNTTRLDVSEGRVRLTRTADGARVEVPKDHYAIAAAKMELNALPRTGSILREYWTNLVGDNYETRLTSNTNFPNHPSGRELLPRLEVPQNWGNRFGDRICGYLHPPKTGNYVFFLSGNDGSRLWLSPDENPDNRLPIAFADGIAPGEWTKTPSQLSVPLALTAGKRYYLEVLRTCVTGPDHLAVAWQPPGGQREVIPGEVLSPFKLVNQKGKNP